MSEIAIQDGTQWADTEMGILAAAQRSIAELLTCAAGEEPFACVSVTFVTNPEYGVGAAVGLTVPQEHRELVPQLVKMAIVSLGKVILADVPTQTGIRTFMETLHALLQHEPVAAPEQEEGSDGVRKTS